LHNAKKKEKKIYNPVIIVNTVNNNTCEKPGDHTSYVNETSHEHIPHYQYCLDRLHTKHIPYNHGQLGSLSIVIIYTPPIDTLHPYKYTHTHTHIYI